MRRLIFPRINGPNVTLYGVQANELGWGHLKFNSTKIPLHSLTIWSRKDWNRANGLFLKRRFSWRRHRGCSKSLTPLAFNKGLKGTADSFSLECSHNWTQTLHKAGHSEALGLVLVPRFRRKGLGFVRTFDVNFVKTSFHKNQILNFCLKRSNASFVTKSCFNLAACSLENSCWSSVEEAKWISIVLKEIMNTVWTETLCSSQIELVSENRKASVRIKGTVKIADCIQFVSMRLVWKIILHRSGSNLEVI